MKSKNTVSARHCISVAYGLSLALLCVFAVLSGAHAGAAAAAGGGANPTSTDPVAPTGIRGLSSVDGKQSPDLQLGLWGRVIVELDGTGPLNPRKWALVLDGQAMPDLSDTAVVSENPRGLIFQLRRTDADRAAWTQILGSPTFSREVQVSLSPIGADGKVGEQRLSGLDPAHPPVFTLDILSTWWLMIAVVVVGAVMFLLGLGAVRTPMLRDGLLPQVPALERQFSLGRCQMAFWFTLVIASYLFLWVLLWDYNTVTSQALTLMGIAAATGLGAMAANTSNTGGLDDAKKKLVAAGFNSADDIESLRTDLPAKLQETQPSDALKEEIVELERRQKVYDDSTKGYITATYIGGGRYAYRKVWIDLVTDENGPALHRLQVIGWTIVLGLVFVVGVYRELAMPVFSEVLLALIAVSGATYVGFKFPEKT